MNKITITESIKASINKVWEYYTGPEHIVKWNAASDDWHTTRAENDLHVGGKFCSHMEAKDGSVGFDFEGTYREVKEHELLVYELADKRQVKVTFEEKNNSTLITVVFDPETENSLEMQRGGWQAILTNFRTYVAEL